MSSRKSLTPHKVPSERDALGGARSRLRQAATDCLPRWSLAHADARRTQRQASCVTPRRCRSADSGRCFGLDAKPRLTCPADSGSSLRLANEGLLAVRRDVLGRGPPPPDLPRVVPLSPTTAIVTSFRLRRRCLLFPLARPAIDKRRRRGRGRRGRPQDGAHGRDGSVKGDSHTHVSRTECSCSGVRR